MSEWIRITERCPDAGIGILVTDGKIVTAAKLEYYFGNPWWWGSHGFSGHDWEFEFSEPFRNGAITHWMPLPPPPI